MLDVNEGWLMMRVPRACIHFTHSTCDNVSISSKWYSRTVLERLGWLDGDDPCTWDSG